MVEIIDHRGEKFEALTFGGRLQIDSQESFTTCTLQSPAPILIITDARPIEKLFVDEIRILLAERRAERLAEPHSFEERLINADILELYISIINALVGKMEHTHHKENTQITQLLNFIHNERKRIQEERLVPIYIYPDIDDIL